MVGHRKLVLACLFVTGAVTIALELIASRILTPYVGGSLYVWTAILSITLLALAGGYHLGGLWSHRQGHHRLFVRFPAATAIVLCVTAWSYPVILPAVAYDDALVGAFVGSVLILAPTLVLLSAMGPIGVSLTATAGGDRGAGRIFAVSTVGSVAGAPVAAFLLLPYMSPVATLVVLAGVLAGVSVAALIRVRDGLTARALLPASAVAIAIAGLTAFGARDAVDLGDVTATHVATVRGPHASVVVVDLRHDRHAGRVRLYLEENQMQSAQGFGVPGEPLRYATIATAALEGMVPDGGRILLLGLAGGTMATDLAAAGYTVEAVDVNPRAVDVAQRWFGFDADAVPVTIGDARRFLTRCPHRYDAVVFDVFSGLTAPDHLVTREAFAAAGGCLAPGGLVLANTIVPPLDARPTQRLMAALAHGLSAPVAVYQDPDPQANNRIMVAAPGHSRVPVLRIADYPVSLFERAARTITPVVLPLGALEGVSPLSDRSNDFALGMARLAAEMGFFPVPPAWH